MSVQAARRSLTLAAGTSRTVIYLLALSIGEWITELSIPHLILWEMRCAFPSEIDLWTLYLQPKSSSTSPTPTSWSRNAKECSGRMDA